MPKSCRESISSGVADKVQPYMVPRSVSPEPIMIEFHYEHNNGRRRTLEEHLPAYDCATSRRLKLQKLVEAYVPSVTPLESKPQHRPVDSWKMQFELTSSGWTIIEAEKSLKTMDAPFSDAAIFLAIVKQIPSCIRLLEVDTGYRRRVVVALKKGAAATDSADSSIIAGAITFWLDEYCQHVAARANKTLRGFVDNELGRLLCPPRLDWKNKQ
ncbi:hypothetical protein FRC03_009924 [Tulasnella sp. 419]|nr:hypothetical protein FRC03_009924 [Tulasnella sp. 419]